MQPIVAYCCKVMYFGCFDFMGELGFLNCDDVCMCAVNKQFELLEFVSESVYVCEHGESGWVAWSRVWKGGVVLCLCVL